MARRGKYRRAIQIWRDLLDSESEEALLAGELIRNKIATTYYRLSLQALRAKGRTSRKALLRAVERLRQAVKYEEAPNYLVELSRCYLRLSDLERADQTLVRTLQVAPAEETALYYAAVVKLRRGDVQAARELCDRAPKTSAHGGWWRRLRALCFGVAGEIPKALAELAAPPPGVPATVWCDDVVALLRASSPSLETLATVETLLPAVEEKAGEREAGELWALCGDAYARMGEYEKAVRCWAEATTCGENPRGLASKVAMTCESRIVDSLRQGRLDDAVRWHRLGNELGAGDAVRHLEGLIDFYLGKDAWARGDYTTAAERFGASLRWRASADVAVRLAIVFEALGDWPGAAGAWKSVFDLAPSGDPGLLLEAARREGLAHVRVRAFDKAAAAFGRFLDIDADDEIFLYLGCCLLQMGQWQPALGFFERALEECGEHPKLLVGLAIAAELSEKSLEEQERAWRRAAHGSDEPWVYHVWRQRLLKLAQKHLEEGNLNQALECYVSLLVEDLDDSESWLWCGAIHLKRGRLPAARKCFSAALNAGGSARACLFAGSRLLEAGEEEEAFTFFREAVRLDTTGAADLEIAERCWECGRREAAVEYLRRALERRGSGELHLARAGQLSVWLGDPELTRSVMMEILKLSSEPTWARTLLAAQEIALRRWADARETLQQVERAAAAANDMATAADAAYFREALERAMAFGRIDRAEFHEREMSVAARWVERYTPAGRAADPQAELLSWIRRQLYIAGALDPADRKRVEQGELPLPGTQMPKLFAFEEPLPVSRLLAHEPAWS